jgi:NADH-quinone oxidoreductase subunit N
LVLLARLVTVFSAAVPVPVEMPSLAPLAWAIGIMASVTCTVANFAAYRQTSVKRLLAYSSIAHAGYMMMAAAVFLFPTGATAYAGLTVLFVYIIVYLFMNLGAFGVTALVQWDTGSDDIDSFTGLIRRSPGLAVPMVICLMSLVGLPPLAGFLGKWWVLLALGNMGTTLGWVLIVVMVLNTLVSLYFYLRIVVRITLYDTGQRDVHSPIGGLALVNVCAVVLLVLFFAAGPLKATANRFTSHLFEPVASKRADHTGLASIDRSAP